MAHKMSKYSQFGCLEYLGGHVQSPCASQKSKEHAPCRAVAVKDAGKVTEINDNLHRDLFGDLSPFQQRTQTWFFVEKVAKGSGPAPGTVRRPASHLDSHHCNRATRMEGGHQYRELHVQEGD